MDYDFEFIFLDSISTNYTLSIVKNLTRTNFKVKFMFFCVILERNLQYLLLLKNP